VKSIFIKNFATTALLLAFSFLLLAVSFVGIGRTYLIEDYRRGMMSAAGEVAHTASAVARGNSLSDWTMSMVISSISGSTGNHIFITDEEGTIITCSEKRPHCEHIGKQVPSDTIRQMELGSFDQLTTLDGIYPEKRYVVGKPITAETDGTLLGYCFISSEISHMLGAWTSYLSWAIVAFSIVSLIAMLMVMVYYFAVRRKYEKHPFSAKALWREFKGSILALITPIIILSGFTVGWFTPTEASSIAVIYALIISALAYRTMTWKGFLKCLKDSALSSANTLFIIGSSTLFTYVMAMEGISNKIAAFILGISSSPVIILLILNVILLLLGMVMEPGAILTLMLPVLLPVAKAINMDLVHFGVMLVLNLMIGQVTPPFGVCLFVISDVNKLKLEHLYKAILPWCIPLVLTLMLVTYLPGIVTWLPGVLLG